MSQNTAKPGSFRFAHNNLNVTDLDKSLAFYRDALGLVPVSRHDAENFTLVFLGDGTDGHKLELTWLRDFDKDQYDLGDNEMHLAFVTKDIDAARAMHREMDCICFENEAMGIYFIEDPDGYWLEIVPDRS